MPDKMLKFVKIGQQTPPKREVDTRKKDFNEIYDEYINEKAKEQSSRCSQCGVPFCQVHCPLSNNIPECYYLKDNELGLSLIHISEPTRPY